MQQNSQSQRILWLLEELGIEYTLENHLRNPATHPAAFRSPDTLKATGPYGKAPVLITGAADGTRYIPESDAICTYLLRTFDTADAFGLRNGDWIRDEVLNSINLTTLTRATGVALYQDLGALRTAEGPRGQLFQADAEGSELHGILQNLERELKEGPEGGFFMGKQPGRADIMMEFPMSMIKHRNWVDLKTKFPLLDEWLERCYARPAFKRSLEKGNGYDLNAFPKVPKL